MISHFLCNWITLACPARSLPSPTCQGTSSRDQSLLWGQMHRLPCSALFRSEVLMFFLLVKCAWELLVWAGWLHPPATARGQVLLQPRYHLICFGSLGHFTDASCEVALAEHPWESSGKAQNPFASVLHQEGRPHIQQMWFSKMTQLWQSVA